MLTKATVGRRYRHTSRRTTYRVLLIGTIEADGKDAVIYQAEADGRVWVRTREDFEGLNAESYRRFVEIEEDEPPDATPPSKPVPRPRDLPVIDPEPGTQRWCPFCGRASVQVVDSGSPTPERFRVQVRCLRCDALGPACSTPEAAVREWDTRYIEGKFVGPGLLGQ